jgi:hypothetical protein
MPEAVAPSKKKPRGRPFERGHPKVGGRAAGSPNKVTKMAEDILIAAAAACGSDGNGNGEFLGYLRETARLHRPEYLAALMKLCPDRLVVRVGGRYTPSCRTRVRRARGRTPTCV